MKHGKKRIGWVMIVALLLIATEVLLRAVWGLGLATSLFSKETGGNPDFYFAER